MIKIANDFSFKKTKQRDIVLGVLQNNKLPLSAEEIYLTAHQQLQKISFSTIYRILNMLENKNIVIKYNGQDGNSLYELNRGMHQHYLTCLSCNRRVAVHDCPLSDWEARIMRENDFVVKGHRVELYGYCRQCRSRIKMNKDEGNE